MDFHEFMNNSLNVAMLISVLVLNHFFMFKIFLPFFNKIFKSTFFVLGQNHYFPFVSYFLVDMLCFV